MSFDVWVVQPTFSAARRNLFLRSHRRGLHRQRVLDPLVVRDQLAVAEGDRMVAVVGGGISTCVVREHTRHRARRVAKVVHS